MPRGLSTADQFPTSTSVPASSGSPLITPDFLDFFQNLARSHLIPGLAVTVVHAKGDTEYAVWGIGTDVGEPMTIDTMVFLASCSKAFLSAGMGILMDDFEAGRNATPLPQGLTRFDWDTKIKDLLPGEWGLTDEWAEEKASVRDVLSHVSGMPRHDASYDRADTPSSVVSRMRYLRPAYELRERWLYNNQMYMLCSHIIAKYAAIPYTRFVQERIFSPLNMSSTYSVGDALDSGKLAHVWTPQARRIPFPLSEATTELIAGPAGVIASVADLAKWIRMLLHAGVNPSTNTTVIPHAVFRGITTAHAIVPSRTPVTGYGMGWFRTSYLGHDVVWHDGSLPGVSTVVLFAPSEGLASPSWSTLASRGKPMASIPSLAFEPTYPRTHKPCTNSRPPAPPDPPPDFSGTYHNTGYGTIILCSAFDTSSYCRHVLLSFRAIDGGAHNDTHEAEYFAVWPRVRTTHLRFSPIAHMGSQHRYNAVLTSLFPWGYGWDRRPFETPEELGYVDFVIDERTGGVLGFGLVTTDGEEAARKRKGRSVEERADAWFIKVE
ncbi:beta-lactamase/transpeptidase-like protein [Amylostereum chailletii]|nr:beta-lactamase/transpeptidase-like protein [Amylostereum chailletii]